MRARTHEQYLEKCRRRTESMRRRGLLDRPRRHVHVRREKAPAIFDQETWNQEVARRGFRQSADIGLGLALAVAALAPANLYRRKR